MIVYIKIEIFAIGIYRENGLKHNKKKRSLNNCASQLKFLRIYARRRTATSNGSKTADVPSVLPPP